MTIMSIVKDGKTINVDRNNRIILSSDDSMCADGFIKTNPDDTIMEAELIGHLMGAFDYVKNGKNVKEIVGNVLKGRYGVKSLKFWNESDVDAIFYNMKSDTDGEGTWIEICFTAFYADSHSDFEKRAIEFYDADFGYVVKVRDS